MRSILTCGLLLLLLPSFGQTESFNGFSFEHEVTPEWGYAADVQYRRRIESRADNRWLFTLVGNRRLLENLTIAPGIRATMPNGGSSTELRLFSDLNYSLPLGEGPFAVESRLRFQRERLLGEDFDGWEAALRPRLGLSFSPNDLWATVIEYEARYRFDSRNEWSRNRYTLGFERVLTEFLTLDLFFRLEEDLNQVEPETVKTVGLYLLFILPDGRERDWDYRQPFGRSLLW